MFKVGDYVWGRGEGWRIANRLIKPEDTPREISEVEPLYLGWSLTEPTKADWFRAGELTLMTEEEIVAETLRGKA